MMKVLIVDDNRLLCWTMGRMLSKRNIVNQVVEEGKSALSEVRRTFYDIIFLDIHLPDANGLDLMKEIRKISPTTKVVIMSSDGSEDTVRRVLSVGAMRFMEKPFDNSEVMTVLEATLLRKPAPRPSTNE